MSDLKHFGILGMKWGRRKARTSGPSSSDSITARKLQSKKLNELSNDELKRLTTRLQLEKQYKDLSRSELSPGKKFVSDVLMSAGKQLASKYVASIMESGGESLFKLLNKKG